MDNSLKEVREQACRQYTLWREWVDRPSERRWEKQPEYPNEGKVREVLVAEIEKRMPGWKVSIAGPCGIQNKYFLRVDRGLERKDIVIVVDRGGDVAYMDLSVDTGEYPPGSIGWYNRMNHPLVWAPKNATARWFIERMM